MTDHNYVTDEDELFEAAMAARARRIGDYDSNPAVEELAAAWRAAERRGEHQDVPADEVAEPPRNVQEPQDYSVDPW